MRTLITLAIALPLLVLPTAAQDIFKPLQDMVDTLTEQPPERAPRAPRELVPSPPEADEPPVPRPRPPDLPDVPVVTPPVSPMPAAEAPEAVDEPAPDAEDKTEPAAEPEEPAEVAAPAEPERVYQTACPAVIMGLVEAEIAPPLSEGTCGEQSPWVVTGVMSRGRMVPLSSPVTTNCEMASALPGWLEDVDGYAEAMLDSAVAQVDTGTSYMCRARNSSESQFTSEHGFANAVDVTGFTLEDGRSIGVATDWVDALAPEGRLLRLAHDAACGGFMTVLGPEANAEHEDHLHLDMGCHGQACQARICE